MVDYPIGDLIAERVRAMGVIPLYKHFPHNGVNGRTWRPCTATAATVCAHLVFSDPRQRAESS